MKQTQQKTRRQCRLKMYTIDKIGRCCMLIKGIALRTTYILFCGKPNCTAQNHLKRSDAKAGRGEIVSKKVPALKHGVCASTKICQIAGIKIIEKDKKPVRCNLRQLDEFSVSELCACSPYSWKMSCRFKPTKKSFRR